MYVCLQNLVESKLVLGEQELFASAYGLIAVSQSVAAVMVYSTMFIHPRSSPSPASAGSSGQFGADAALCGRRGARPDVPSRR